jgi:iron complex transport system ATP-binding protein
MTLATHGLGVAKGRAKLLRDVSVAFEPGRVTAVVGPNGAGKSTLLATLAGTQKPTDGSVTLDGVSLQRLGSAALAQRRAVLSQDFQVAFPFTVAEVVAMGRLPHELHADLQIVAQAMHAADIASLASRNVLTLSGGERQRVGLAKALAQVWAPVSGMGANWLLLDEPLAALDPVHQREVLRTVRRFAAEGGGIVMVLHDLELATSAADFVLVLKGGAVIDKVSAAALSPALIENVFGVAPDWKRSDLVQ